MKKIIFGLFLGVSLTALTAAGVSDYIVKKKTAEVNQIQGLYVFTDSTPVMEYEYVGTVSGNAISFGSGQYEPVRNSILKKTKQKFPEADGVILHLLNGGIDKADAIKFK
ncbi:MAG: hypothetical protein RIS29_2510 [Bacteroidota bacterium]|jgi:hypothetical protein